MSRMPEPADPHGVDLFWLPLGAGDGTGCVRHNGRLYEALTAALHRRPRCDLYHAALEVRLRGEPFVIEMAPVWGAPEGDRGVVLEGPVGLGPLGRSRWFRYEVRRWPGGRIPDAEWAVDSPQRLSATEQAAARLLDLVPQVPAHVWGRDPVRAGDMWNSNSLVSWLLSRSGHDPGQVRLPPRGRAPGWQAGLVAARRAAG